MAFLSLDRLTQPPAGVVDIERRRQTRMLLTITLVVLVVALVTVPLFLLLNPHVASDLLPVTALVVTLVGTCYVLARIGYYYVSVSLLLGGLIIRFLLLPYFDTQMAPLLYFTILPVFLMGMFLPHRILRWSMITLPFVVLLLNVSQPAPADLSIYINVLRDTVLVFSVAVSAVMWTFVSYRNSIERDKQAELQTANTALETAMATIQAEADKWLAILREAPIFIAFVDVDGNVIFINRTPNADAREAVGLPIEKVLPPGHGAHIRQSIDRIARGEIDSDEFDDSLETPDGHVWLSTRVTPVYANGTLTGITAITSDVTERVLAAQEHQRLQEQIINAQKQQIRDLATPVIPVRRGVIVMPLVGEIDSARAQDITHALLDGITHHDAHTVLIDLTGVPTVDSGVADHLNRTIQAARLKGTHTVVTGISAAVAETIVDLGIDWSGVDTRRDLESGLAGIM